MNDVRILFFGTPDFAVPTLERLVRDNRTIAGVVTNPDEPAGRGGALTPPPVKIAAQKYGLPLFQPALLVPETWKTEFPEADIFVVAAYGHIIKRPLLELPRLGVLNVHPSLLPRWRGPSPIEHTILEGDEKTGVTIMLLDELMDHGPIVAQTTVPLAGSRPVSAELAGELAKRGAELLAETLPAWVSGNIKPQPQNDAYATYSKILKKDDGRIMWSERASRIDRMVRAFNPRPGTWTLWPGGEKIYRIRIERTFGVVDDVAPEGRDGFTWSNNRYPLLVNTGSGSIAVERLTLEGKKSLSAEEFIRGYPSVVGVTFI